MNLDPLSALPAETLSRLAPFLALYQARTLYDELPAPVVCAQGHQYEANRTPRGQYVFPVECPVCEGERIRREQVEALRLARAAEHVRAVHRWNEARWHGLDPAKTISAWSVEYHGENVSERRAGSASLLTLARQFPALVNAIGAGRSLVWLYASNNRGKTHYMHALGWALHEVRTVLAVSSETARDSFFANWRQSQSNSAAPAAARWVELSALAARADVLLLDELHSLATGNGGDSYLFASIKSIIDANIAHGASLVLATNVQPSAVLERWHAAGEGSSERALASRLGHDGPREYDTYVIDFSAVLPWRRRTDLGL